MSDVIPSANIVTERASALTARRIRAANRQHWSSPYAAKRVHLIGVGGCGMSGLAGILIRSGAIVSGSDLIWNETFDRLQELGATITIGHAPVSIPSGCDFLVYSAAIKDDNPELSEAKRRDVLCLKYAEMLGRVMDLRTGIAVAGTHGKSTTTAMLAYILRQAKADPTFVVGADVRQLGGGSGVGDGSHFVVEACEYERSFLSFKPQLAAILNIEEDHLDCFSGIDEITDAFRQFAAGVADDGTILAGCDNPNVAKALENVSANVEAFGFGENADWQAVDNAQERGHYSFVILRKGQRHLHADMRRLPGRHQVLNALAAAALAEHAGVRPDAVADALSQFAGADRRFTLRGESGGITVLDDYGHHPTEVQATLRTLRERYPDRRLWVIFQPHQHSRTRFLLEDFARSFGLADHLLVPDIYFVRDSEHERGAISSNNLVERVRENGADALYLPSHNDIVQHVLSNARSGDVIVTMGAGDVWKISNELVQRLG